MPTADILLEKALELARADAPEDQAVQELLECCGNRRVSAVVARDRAMRTPKPTAPTRSRVGRPVTSTR